VCATSAGLGCLLSPCACSWRAFMYYFLCCSSLLYTLHLLPQHIETCWCCAPLWQQHGSRRSLTTARQQRKEKVRLVLLAENATRRKDSLAPPGVSHEDVEAAAAGLSRRVSCAASFPTPPTPFLLAFSVMALYAKGWLDWLRFGSRWLWYLAALLCAMVLYLVLFSIYIYYYILPVPSCMASRCGMGGWKVTDSASRGTS